MTVYAVAFGSKQQFKPVGSVAELRNLASFVRAGYGQR